MPLSYVTKNEEMPLAVWAAHAACAVSTGAKYAIDGVRTIIERTIPEKQPLALLEKPEPIAEIVIKEMLPKNASGALFSEVSSVSMLVRKWYKA